MTESAIVARSGSDSLATASATRYTQIVGQSDFDAEGSATEADAQLKWRNAGTAQNLCIQVNTNARSTASTLTLRQNSADTALSISITASTTGQFTDTSTVTIADGDLLAYALITGTGTGSIDVTSCAFEMVTSGQCGTMLAFGQAVGMTAFTTASATRYARLNNSDGSWGSSESSKDVYWPNACTLSHLQVYVSANTWASACTIKSRKNGADGGQSVSITASTTGLFEDTTNSDTLALGDRACVALVTPAGSGSITVTVGGVLAKTSTAGESSLIKAGFSGSTAGVFYFTPFGLSSGTIESVQQARVPVAVTLSDLYVYITTNLSTVSVTVKTRINGADGNQSVTIGAGLTGAFTDATNTDVLASGDLYNYISSQAVTGAATGTSIGVVATIGGGGGTNYPQSILATTSPVALLSSSTGKPVLAATTPVSALSRSVAKALNASTAPVSTLSRAVTTALLAATTPVATVAKATAKALAAVTTPVAALATGLVKLMSVLAATTPIAVLTREIGKGISVAASPLAALTRSIATALGASTTPVASVAKDTGKPLATSTAPSATLAAIRTFLKALDAAITPVAAVTMATGKALSASASAVASLVRETAKALAAATTPVSALSALRTHPETLAASTEPAAALGRAMDKPLAVSTSPLASMSKLIGKALSASTTPIAALAKGLGVVLLALADVVTDLATFFASGVEASPERTLAIRGENRVLAVEAEDRTLAVQGEDRTLRTI